jgi:hypothetical protein
MKRQFIPRPLRACLWALLVIVLAILYYIALGCPTLSLRQELRRAEKVHLVGPSKIVDQVNGELYSEFEKMLVGETEHGIIFFGRFGSSRSGPIHEGTRSYELSYIEKTGDMTFAAPPTGLSYFPLPTLPVYIFTEYADAVRATISIQATGSRIYNKQNVGKVEDPFDVSFHAEADRDENGFFRFLLTAKSNQPQDPFGYHNDSAYALLCISCICSGESYYDNCATMVIPITVTLYDAEGNEIVTRQLQLGPYEQEKG